MIIYDENSIRGLIFRLEGSVAPKAALMALPAGVLAALLLLLEFLAPGYRENLGLMEINASALWTGTTATSAFLVSLRTNRAVARFWEGTSLLHQMRGEWFDAVSCCVSFTRASKASKPGEVAAFRHTLVRLMSLAHRSSLEEISEGGVASMEAIDPWGLDDLTLIYLKNCKTYGFNRVEVLIHMIQTLITAALDDGTLKISPPILSRVYQTLSRGFVNLLNVKKIVDTKFPFPYAQMIALLLIFQTVCTPILLTGYFSNPVWAFLFSFVPCFGLWGVNLVATQLENPFGKDENDLPLHQFQADMNKCLMMLLQEQTDLLATAHPHRCIKDFLELVTHMRVQREGPSVDILVRNGTEFGLDFPILRRHFTYTEEEFIEMGVEEDAWEKSVSPKDGTSISLVTNDVDATSGNSYCLQEPTDPASIDPSGGDEAAVTCPITEGGVDSITGSASFVCKSDVARAHHSVASGGGAVLVDEGPRLAGTASAMGIVGFSSSMEDFQNALCRWTAVVEGQLGELQWNLTALKAFHGAIAEELNFVSARGSGSAVAKDLNSAAVNDSGSFMATQASAGGLQASQQKVAFKPSLTHRRSSQASSVPVGPWYPAPQPSGHAPLDWDKPR